MQHDKETNIGNINVYNAHTQDFRRKVCRNSGCYYMSQSEYKILYYRMYDGNYNVNYQPLNSTRILTKFRTFYRNV